MRDCRQILSPRHISEENKKKTKKNKKKHLPPAELFFFLFFSGFGFLKCFFDLFFFCFFFGFFLSFCQHSETARVDLITVRTTKGTVQVSNESVPTKKNIGIRFQKPARNQKKDTVSIKSLKTTSKNTQKKKWGKIMKCTAFPALFVESKAQL